MVRTQRRNGRTLYSEPELFWTRVTKRAGDACWEWAGGREKSGYGHMYVRDWYDESGRRHFVWAKAHRRAWELTYGPIPDGLVVCHRCDNPPCVRPDHLFLGTGADNAQDCVIKGRLNSRRGLRNPNAKLSVADVVAMRAACASGETQQAVADRFGIHQGYLSRVIRRKAWVEA